MPTLPAIPPGRIGQLVLGCDPGANMGFALVRTDPELVMSCVRRSEVLLMTTRLEIAAKWVSELGNDLIILIEDQYAGVASMASRTTLSQRAGHISGYFAGAGADERNLIFVKPAGWYKACGMPSGCTKAVAMARIEHALTEQEKSEFDLLCGINGAYPNNRLDVAAAIGIAWSFPFLAASALSRGQKMRALKEQPTIKKSGSRRAKAKKRVAKRRKRR